MLDIAYKTFDGPLDLLLQLIEKEEFDITEVSLAKVTDDYIQLLARLAGAHHMDELADFLVVAAKLILIKSRSLLPQLHHEEEEEIHDLQRQLKLYQEFQYAAKMIESLYAAGVVGFPRPYVREIGARSFLAPKALTCQILLQAYTLLASRRVSVRRIRGISFDERITIHDKMEHIRNVLASRMQLYFHHLIRNAASKTDIIVSFLALLELVKQRAVAVTQKKIFDDISVESVPS